MTHVSATSHRIGRCRCVLTLVVVVTASSWGCSEVCEQPACSINIAADRIDPANLERTIVSRDSPFAAFSAESAVTTQGGCGPRQFDWYYDYTSAAGVPMPFYSLCGDGPSCVVSVCTKPNATDKTHRLLLVVSDGPLKTDAKDPLDFPVGTAFDTVQWQLELVGVCP